MHPHRFAALLLGLVGLATLGGPPAARADFVIYNLPGSDLVIMLEGEVRKEHRTVLVTTKFGDLVLNRDFAEVLPGQSMRRKNAQLLNKAVEQKDVEGLWRHGKESIRYGAPYNFFKAVEQIAEIDPSHEASKPARELVDLISQEIPESEDEVKAFKKYVKKGGMKVARSDHFILYYDTSEKPPKGAKKPRHEQRLELMERVYHGFLGFFYARGVKLEVPKKRLHVVLFKEKEHFAKCAADHGNDVQGLEGFYSPKINVSFFYDHASHPDLREFKKLHNELEGQIGRIMNSKASNRGDIIGLIKIIGVTLNLEREKLDLEVITHEATHHLAGACGLFPREGILCAWVHEGLASYFEAPKDASWSGVGTVNDERIDLYRILEKRRDMSNIAYITGDRGFNEAGNLYTKVHAYGQAWALTHFLMDNHFDEFMRFYQTLSRVERTESKDGRLDRATYERHIKKLQAAFDSVFPLDQRESLDASWREYMNGLKTDLEVAIGDYVKKYREKYGNKRRGRAPSIPGKSGKGDDDDPFNK